MTIEFLSDNSIKLEINLSVNSNINDLFPVHSEKGTIHLIQPGHIWHPNDGSKFPVLIIDCLYDKNKDICNTKQLPDHTWYFPNQSATSFYDFIINDTNIICKYAPLTPEGINTILQFKFNRLKKNNKILKNKNKHLVNKIVDLKNDITFLEKSNKNSHYDFDSFEEARTNYQIAYQYMWELGLIENFLNYKSHYSIHYKI